MFSCPCWVDHLCGSVVCTATPCYLTFEGNESQLVFLGMGGCYVLVTFPYTPLCSPTHLHEICSDRGKPKPFLFLPLTSTCSGCFRFAQEDCTGRLCMAKCALCLWYAVVYNQQIWQVNISNNSAACLAWRNTTTLATQQDGQIGYISSTQGTTVLHA